MLCLVNSYQGVQILLCFVLYPLYSLVSRVTMAVMAKMVSQAPQENQVHSEQTVHLDHQETLALLYIIHTRQSTLAFTRLLPCRDPLDQ